MANKYLIVEWKALSSADGYEVYEQLGEENQLLVSIFDSAISQIEIPGKRYGRDKVYFAVPFTMNKEKRQYLEALPAEVRLKLPEKALRRERKYDFKYEPPVLKRPQIMKGGVYVSWQETENVPQYRVFRRSGKQRWSFAGDVSTGFYLDKNVESGNVYHYTVRCLDETGTVYLSNNDKKGVTIRFIADQNWNNEGRRL